MFEDIFKIIFLTFTEDKHINLSDLRKLYTSACLSLMQSPETLQNEVQFDIRFYFARRTNENVDKFGKDTFTIQWDPDTNLCYVVKQIDEMTKNYKENSTELIFGCMPEVRGSPMCPVSSFEKYLNHLNPEVPLLWQKPKTWQQVAKSGNAKVWFCKSPIGVNTLREFMARMSHAASLSCVYTNHSIRAAGCTFLHRSNFSPKQIMSVTGHHSLNSLSIYEKVSTNEKLTMGMCMNYYLATDNFVTSPALQAVSPGYIKKRTQPRSILPKKTTPTSTVTRPLQEKENEPVTNQ